MIEEEFLKPLGITQTKLAEKMGVPVQSVNLIINGRRAVTADMAWKLEKALDMPAYFWMNLQTALDLWDAKQKIAHGG
jgi:addiction module HigA family antidote